MLSVLSRPLASALAQSSTLNSNMGRVRSTAELRMGLDDKWLGSAVQRHIKCERLVVVNLYGASVIADTYGIHVSSTTILYHARAKAHVDADFFAGIQNFSRANGCLGAAGSSKVKPMISCSPVQQGNAEDNRGPCLPPRATYCTVTPPCRHIHYELNYSHYELVNRGSQGRDFDRSSMWRWVRCDTTALRKRCQPGFGKSIG